MGLSGPGVRYAGRTTAFVFEPVGRNRKAFEYGLALEVGG